MDSKKPGTTPNRKRLIDVGNDDSDTIDIPTSMAVSSKAKKMMINMGFIPGQGLGLKGQGSRFPVALSSQLGRQGLGYQPSRFDPLADEVVRVVEQKVWLTKCASATNLRVGDWIELGQRKLSMENEHTFCNPEVLKGVLDSKSALDNLDKNLMRRARDRCNPFETIGKAFFQNRAALKMANIDAACDFMFTCPKDRQGVVRESDPLFFADICAGPGGFSEYVLWRKGWLAKGFGFTLRGKDDFKIDNFFAASVESFEPCYGQAGDGDVYKGENILHFRDYVKANTGGKGVHFTMADGGFSVEGRENIQEILSHRLYLCQCLVALTITRPGGHFVVKLFDIYTQFSAGLVWLMRQVFQQICIFKPNSSRPANSERYLVCRSRLEDVSKVRELLWAANEKFSTLAPDFTICSIVPQSVLFADKQFMDYVFRSNNTLGRRQTDSLNKIRAFCMDEALKETRQEEVKIGCLSLWKIPYSTRTAPRLRQPEEIFSDLGADLGSQNSKELTPEVLKSQINCLDWRCFAVSSSRQVQNCTLFLSAGRGNVYIMHRGEWKNASAHKMKLDLPAKTLLYGEIVYEYRGAGSAQISQLVLHVIDAHQLGDISIGHLSFKERYEYCIKFVRAVNKATRPDLMKLRMKTAFSLTGLEELYENLTMRNIKRLGEAKRLCLTLNERVFVEVNAVYLLRVVRMPWSIEFSCADKRKYWCNSDLRVRVDKPPTESIADFSTCVCNRVNWWWDQRVNLSVNAEENCLDPSVVHRVSVTKRINAKL